MEQRQTANTELVKPVRESLDKVDAKIQEIEKTRAGAYEALTVQVRTMMEAQGQLRMETGNLVAALRSDGRAAKPGSAFEYSNFGAAVLGEALASAWGCSSSWPRRRWQATVWRCWGRSWGC